jgi:hypothetical protein
VVTGQVRDNVAVVALRASGDGVGITGQIIQASGGKHL